LTDRDAEVLGGFENRRPENDPLAAAGGGEDVDRCAGEPGDDRERWGVDSEMSPLAINCASPEDAIIPWVPAKKGKSNTMPDAAVAASPNFSRYVWGSM
jgi:hypothetical protein